MSLYQKLVWAFSSPNVLQKSVLKESMGSKLLPMFLRFQFSIGKTLSDINHSKILYDPSPRVMEIKTKINKWDLIKLKSFCTMK